ncbi:hypothetical protein SLEP1_g48845 [Rubroshorea leprosula]|uniref:Uncharacterized protein n=1 Tax=Rubroshorea leprosula TaxID=152421 RepID=A0AAV5LW14_9ROSI|nr:hypothetical protein SLEP1_g48845 [Rubroshorea leprosula]
MDSAGIQLKENESNFVLIIPICSSMAQTYAASLVSLKDDSSTVSVYGASR